MVSHPPPCLIQSLLRFECSKCCILSTLVQKFTNVFLGFLGAVRVANLSQKLRQILASKFPLERFSLVLPIVLKIEEALGDGVEVGEVARPGYQTDRCHSWLRSDRRFWRDGRPNRRYRPRLRSGRIRARRAWEYPADTWRLYVCGDEPECWFCRRPR
jgi:hypothetical protein